MAAPESYDDLVDLLALYEAPNTDGMPDVPDLLRAVTADGAWDDGRQWAAAVRQAIALSCDYHAVAEEHDGRRVSFWDDEGPLRARWFEAPYSLLPAVFEALIDAAHDKPPQWGALLIAALGRIEACGIDDFDRIDAAVAAAAGLPCEDEARMKRAALVAAHPALLRDAG